MYGAALQNQEPTGKFSFPGPRIQSGMYGEGFTPKQKAEEILCSDHELLMGSVTGKIALFAYHLNRKGKRIMLEKDTNYVIGIFFLSVCQAYREQILCEVTF